MKGPNKRENTILLNICTERLEFLNPPSPNQMEREKSGLLDNPTHA